MKRTLGTWLMAACAAAAGCSGSPPTQVLTGNVTTTGAVAIRAIANGSVVTASRVRSDGSFTLALPAGARYRLEVLSPNGVTRVVDRAAADITFAVCAPSDPFDMGTVGTGGGGPGCDPAGNCPPPCDPTTDPGCPPPCDPTTDANCKPPPPPPCDPNTDAGCPPPPCDPATDASCPPPCDPTADGSCPPPCDPNTDPNCKPPPGCDPDGTCPPPCDPMADAGCPTPPPPCADPNDPTTCKDPCMDDPALCGCGGGGPANSAGSTDPGSCWPPPCDGPDCGPTGGTCHPNNPPPDFGCKDPSGA